MTELIKKLKKGDLNLAPSEFSGWYDHCIYPLEGILLLKKMPEASKLVLTASYEKELEELFKAVWALTRETHIKQLEIPGVEKCALSMTIKLYPKLSFEPLATYYLRRAKSYRFIRNLLLTYFKEPAVNSVTRTNGNPKKSLLEELYDMEALFYGAYLIVVNEIGLNGKHNLTDVGSGRGKEKDIEFAKNWIKEVAKDQDVATDCRMMVPVFYDIKKQKTKAWCFLGYTTKLLCVDFASTPKIINAAGTTIKFSERSYMLYYPVFAEVYVSTILNREEFRKLCDKYLVKSKIIEALSK